MLSAQRRRADTRSDDVTAVMAKTDSRRRVRLAIALGVGLVVHLTHLVFLRAADPTWTFPHGNARGFMELADLIAAGDLLGGDEVFFYGPLYPYFLAACAMLSGDGGGGVDVPRFLQAFLTVATAAFAFRTTRRTLGEPAAWGALAFALAFGPAFFFEAQLVATTLATFLLALSLDLFVGAWRGGSKGEVSRALHLLGSGAALGLCAWGRGNTLLLAPVFLAWATWLARAAWLAWRGGAGARARRSVLATVAFVVGLAAVIAPVTVRNAVVGGDAVLLVSQGGINLFAGNNPEAFGVFHLPEHEGIETDVGRAYVAATERAARERLGAGRELSPSEVDAYWRDRAIAWVLENPFDFAALTARKLRLLTSGYEVPIHRNWQVQRELSPVTRLPLPGWTALWALSAAGLVLALGSRRTRRDGWLLATLAAAHALSVLAFFVVDRYRHPQIVLVLPFAGLAVATAWAACADLVRRRWGSLRRRLGRRHAVGAVVLATIVALLAADAVPGVRWNPLTPELVARYEALDRRRRAAALSQLGRDEEALVELRRGLAAAPGHLASRLDEADLLARLDRPAEAADILGTVLRLAPETAEAHRLLAEIALAPPPSGLDDSALARRHARAFSEMRPGDPRGRELLARVSGRDATD